jgi:hypothetical protein
LRWAVGNLEDGSTLLVTDLAGGWIPPGIDIPSGVLLLQPRRCTGDVATLLGPATLTAEYQPGQQLCAADDESMETSGQTWQTTPVDDLGWELAKRRKDAAKAVFEIPIDLASVISCPAEDWPAVLKGFGIAPAEKNPETGAVTLWRYVARARPDAEDRPARRPPRVDTSTPKPEGAPSYLLFLIEYILTK